MEIIRQFVNELEERVSEKKPLIQVVLGPRQVGKTTGVKQLLERVSTPQVYGAADQTLATPANWIQQLWQEASEKGPNTILVIDEIQKIENWSESIKALWDAQESSNQLRVILLGSSSLQLQKGLTESLTGRFELLKVHHWNLLECKEAFGLSFDSFLQFGGYPGSIKFIDNYERWYSYIKDSIVETVIGKDILDAAIVERPALFRQAFEILCSYPAQEISYTKLLGQLQDKGNTDLIKRYIELYENAFLLKSLQKFSTKVVKTKSSSPKLIPLCPAVITLQLGSNALDDAEKRGRYFEAAVGADLHTLPGNLYYWREGKNEVDFVYSMGSDVYAIEVKSGRKKSSKGLNYFCQQFKGAKSIMVTPKNYSLFVKNPGDFLKTYALK